MSKKNKGGVKSQTTKQTPVTKQATTEVENKTVENKPVKESKKTSTKPAVPDPATSEQAATTDTNVVVMKPQENTPTSTFLKSILEESKKSEGLSPDGTVTLANLIQKRYVDNKAETVEKFGQPFLDGMNTVADALIVTTVIQQVVSTNTPFALLIKNSAYPQIQSLAKTFDIELPPIDKLALPQIAGKKDGTQLELEFKPDMISEDIRKRVLAEAAKATETAPELDPKKFEGVDDVRAAITYLLSRRDDAKNGIAKNLLSAIKLVKDYRYHEIEGDAEAEAKKKALDARTIGDWMTDMATFSEPTLIYETLGFAMVKTIVNEKCPVGAFLDARHIFTNKGECAFTDSEIAIIVRLLVSWYCTYSIAKNNTILSKKKITDAAKNAAKHEIERCEVALHYTTNFDNEIIESVADVFGAESTSVAKKLYYFTRGQYYGKQISGTKDPESEFENLLYNVCQRVGLIANLFKSPAEFNDKYAESNIQDLIKSQPKDAKQPEGKGESEPEADGATTATEEGEGKK